MLALSDASAAILAIVALPIAFGGRVDTALWAAVFVPAWVLLAKLHGLYDRDQQALRHLTVDEAPAIVMWALTATAATAGLLVPMPAPALDMGSAARLWLVAAVSAFALRGLARFAWRAITPRDRTLIIGHGALAEATRRKLQLFPDIHVNVVGEPEAVSVSDLEEDHHSFGRLDRIILASHMVDEKLIADLVAFCRRGHISLSVVPPARGMFGTAVRLNHVADLPLVEYSTWDVSRSTLFLNRAIDVLISATALLLLAPIFTIIALAIRADSRGPVFFVQQRAGVDGRPFRMRKFRTMVADAEERLGDVIALDSLRDPMFKLRRDPRVTQVGSVLRRTSLDELPQLWNVLKGDMSLVGPRPEQLELVERYRPEHRFRLAVKPGVTGPMQVFGRGELTFEERLAVEREYIENLSLGRDLRILAMTIPTALGGRGAF